MCMCCSGFSCVPNDVLVPAQASLKRKEAKDADDPEAPANKKLKPEPEPSKADKAAEKPEKKEYDEECYFQPAGNEAFVWEHMWEHKDFPGWVQCWLPTQKDVFGKQGFCKQWFRKGDGTSNAKSHCVSKNRHGAW
jgi:hypothetical protein